MTAAIAPQRSMPTRWRISRSSPRPTATGMPARFGETDAGGFGVALDRHHGDAALLQHLGEAEADLAEADQHDVVAGGRGAGAEEGGEATAAEPADQGRGEDRDEDDGEHHVGGRDQLEPGRRRLAAPGGPATVATERVEK